MESIITALITGGLALIGTALTVSSSQKKTEHKLETAQAVTDCKIEELTREVRLHNNFAQRVPVMEEQIRVINHRIADLGFLTEFMVPVIVGICLCVGYVIKKWIKDVDNKWIPTVCAALGVILAIWMNGWSVSPSIILSGLFSGLASTGLHQLFKQYLEKGGKTE